MVGWYAFTDSVPSLQICILTHILGWCSRFPCSPCSRMPPHLPMFLPTWLAAEVHPHLFMCHFTFFLVLQFDLTGVLPTCSLTFPGVPSPSHVHFHLPMRPCARSPFYAPPHPALNDDWLAAQA